MPTPLKHLPPPRGASLLALLASLPVSVYAQTWDGSTGNSNWTTGGNWTPSGTPLNDGSANVTFAGSTRLTPNQNGNWSIASLAFASGASSFTLGSSGGSTLTIGTGGITQNSANLQTIANSLTLGGSQTWNTASGDLTVSGSISSGYITFTKSGPGNLTLSGNNSGLTGPIQVSAGTLTATNNNSLGGSTYGNTVSSGATLAIQGGITVTEGDLTIAGPGVGGNGALRSTSGNNTLAADLKLSANATVASDANTLTLANTVTTNGYTLTLSGAGAIVASQAIDGGGTVTTTGSGDRTFNGAINNGFTVSGAGAVVVNQSINAGSAAVTLNGSGSVALNGSAVNAGSLSIGGSTSVSSASTLNLGGGDLTVGGSGAVTLGGSAINVGNVVVSGSGDTALDTQISASGSFTQSGSGSTTFGGGGTNYFSSVNITDGEVILDKTSGYAIQVSGAVSISGADLVFEGDNQIANWNDVTLGSGATLYLNDTTQSIDQLTIGGDAIIDFGTGASTFDVSALTFDGAYTLTILNWNSAVDSFLADVSPGSNLPRIIFDGYGEAVWSGGSLVPGTPIPEPRTYGLLSVGGLVALSVWRRRPRLSRPA